MCSPCWWSVIYAIYRTSIYFGTRSLFAHRSAPLSLEQKNSSNKLKKHGPFIADSRKVREDYYSSEQSVRGKPVVYTAENSLTSLTRPFSYNYTRTVFTLCICPKKEWPSGYPYVLVWMLKSPPSDAQNSTLKYSNNFWCPLGYLKIKLIFDAHIFLFFFAWSLESTLQHNWCHFGDWRTVAVLGARENYYSCRFVTLKWEHLRVHRRVVHFRIKSVAEWRNVVQEKYTCRW